MLGYEQDERSEVVLWTTLSAMLVGRVLSRTERVVENSKEGEERSEQFRYGRQTMLLCVKFLFAIWY